LQSLQNAHTFFFEMAQITLQYKPPLGFFGNIQTESAHNGPPAFNVKAALLPIVNFARIYALKNNILETATLSRLQVLHEQGLLVETSLHELALAFDVLVKMRLNHQTKQILGRERPDNLIKMSELSQMEKTLLKKILSDILVFQARVSRDFARTA
jgi:CBS domain-containing protein